MSRKTSSNQAALFPSPATAKAARGKGGKGHWAKRPRVVHGYALADYAQADTTLCFQWGACTMSSDAARRGERSSTVAGITCRRCHTVLMKYPQLHARYAEEQAKARAILKEPTREEVARAVEARPRETAGGIEEGVNLSRKIDTGEHAIGEDIGEDAEEAGEEDRDAAGEPHPR